MAKHYELIVSTRDAEALALILDEHRRGNPLDTAAANELAELLMEARLVPHELLPDERVAMGSRVTYLEKPGDALRTVILVHPVDAKPASGRISVLAPIGLALLGRAPGAVIAPAVPTDRTFNVRILESSRDCVAVAA